MARLIHYEYHRPGKGTTVFDQWLVVDRPDVKVLLTEHHEGTGIQVGDEIVLETGAPVVWFVFPNRAHDVGRFCLADGTPTGWYTNLCTPVECQGNRWRSTDLFLDLWTSPAGQHRWLDEDEYEEALQAGIVGAAEGAMVSAERRRIARRVAEGAWPPAVAREIDGAAARRLMTAP